MNRAKNIAKNMGIEKEKQREKNINALKNNFPIILLENLEQN